MDKFNELVELTKIINNTPFTTLWIYWETDMEYVVTDTTDIIIVRSHDKRISGNESWIESLTDTDVPIPVGTYSIGVRIPEGIGMMVIGSTFEVGAEIPIYFSFVVKDVGYIDHVIYGTSSVVQENKEEHIPNIGEEYIEWETIDKKIKPFYKESISNYTFGASYSVLTRRSISNIIETYHLTDANGVILNDDDFNKLIY